VSSIQPLSSECGTHKTVKAGFWPWRSGKGRQKALRCSIFAPLLRGANRRFRSRANVAHSRQSRPDSGLGFQAKVVKTFQGVPSSLECSYPEPLRNHRAPRPFPQGANLISHKLFIESFRKSPFPHKSVNLIFILVIVKDELTDLRGS